MVRSGSLAGDQFGLNSVEVLRKEKNYSKSHEFPHRHQTPLGALVPQLLREEPLLDG